MKTLLTHIFVLGLMGLLASCGGDNSAPGGSSSSTGLYGSPSAISEVNNLKSQLNCDYGPRMRDVVFNSTNPGSPTVIAGPFNQGPLSGNITETFIGANYYTKDIIIVSKVSSGGYNVIMSMCPLYTQGSSGSPIISDQRALHSFQAPSGIYISSHTNCAVGNVDSAYTTMISAAWQHLPDFLVETTFSKYCW